MLLKEFLPPPPYRDFVKWYRIVHFKFENPADSPIKIYPPKPEVCLHFFICGGEKVSVKETNKKYRSTPVVLTGQYVSVMRRKLCPDFFDFQVVFQPTGLFRLTGIPAHELTNAYLDAAYIFSKSLLNTTLDQLQQVKEYTELLPIADFFITALLQKSKIPAHPLDAAIKMMSLYKGRISLDDLANKSCLSSRQFERKYYERVGLHPKTFAKIVRFNRAYNLKNALPEIDWLETAMACGYYDYQHLSRDYKELTGFTPAAFHHFEESAPERILGLTSELYKDRNI